MEGHPIENIMTTTMENIKEMIDVNTIVGDAVETSEGTVIIPVSRVSFGFVAGGGEYNEDVSRDKINRISDSTNTSSQDSLPFAGGTGAGVSVNPIAFLVVSKDKIKLLPVNFNTTVDRVVELVPQVVDQIQDLIDKNKIKKQGTTLTKEFTQ
ncbi:MAG: GerW family sporulation protein [Caldicoprobacterales bacterium]|nr:sporulation protein YtfJ [Clostridiales bacterium]